MTTAPATTKLKRKAPAPLAPSDQDLVDNVEALLENLTEPEPAADPADAPAPAAVVVEPVPHPTIWDRLAAPFAADEIELLPKQLRKDDREKHSCDEKHPDRNGLWCGGYHAASVHLHYVGHAGITTRLNEVAGPDGWSWEPVEREVDPIMVKACVDRGDTDMLRMLMENAPPKIVNGRMWIRLTIHGVTKLGFGDADGKSGANAIKEVIGDALRNAGMRFGIATYLWSKSDSAQAKTAFDEADKHVEPDLPDPEIVKMALTRAVESNGADNAAIVAEVLKIGGVYGQDVLDKLRITTAKGDIVSGADYLSNILGYYRSQAVKAAEAAKAAQDAAEGPTVDVNADTQPEPPATDPVDAPADTALPSEQAPAAPADATPTREQEIAQQDAPTPAPAPTSAPAPAQQPPAQAAASGALDEITGDGTREQMTRMAMGEVKKHAEVLGQAPRVYIEHLMSLAGTDNPNLIPLIDLTEFLIGQRALIVDTLRAQGEHNQADALASARAGLLPVEVLFGLGRAGT